MLKSKLKDLSDWLLLTRAGETLLIIFLVGFCLAVAATVWIIGIKIDNYHKPQDKPKINETVDFDIIRL